MTIRCLVSIEVGPTVLIMNSVLVAVGMRLRFVDRSLVYRSVVDRNWRREREMVGSVVSSVVGLVVGSCLGEDNNCQSHNKELNTRRNEMIVSVGSEIVLPSFLH